METVQANNDSRVAKASSDIRAVESGLRTEIGDAKKELSAEIGDVRTELAELLVDLAALKTILDTRNPLTFLQFLDVILTAVLTAIGLFVAILAIDGDFLDSEAGYRGIVLDAQAKRAEVDATQDERLDIVIELLEERAGISSEERN